MADDVLSWTLRLDDQMTPAAAKAAKALKGVKGALRDLERPATSQGGTRRGGGGVLEALRGRGAADPRLSRFDALGRQAAALGRSNRPTGPGSRGGTGAWSPVFKAHVAEFGERMAVRAFDAMTGLASASAEAAMAVGRVAVSFERSVIASATFREGVLTTFRTILGGSGAANEELQQAIRIARETPLDVGQVIDIRRSLVAAGFRDSHDRDVLTALTTDVAALNPNDPSTGQRLGVALSQIQSAGRLRGQEMLQLTNAGLSRAQIFAALGEQFHFRGSAAQVNRQVEHRMQSGGVDSAHALRAIVTSVERLTGGPVGTLSHAQSEGLGGRLSNFQSLWQEMFVGQDIERSSGIQAFSGALGNVNNLLNLGAPLGREFGAAFRSLSDSLLTGLFRDFSGAAGARRLEAMLRQALGLLQSVGRAVDNVMGNIARPLAGGFWDALMVALPAVRSGLEGLGSGTNAQQFAQLGSALGTLTGWLARLAIGLAGFELGKLGALGEMLASLGETFTSAQKMYESGGVGLGQAVVNGLIFALEHLPIVMLNGALNGLAGRAVDMVRAQLGLGGSDGGGEAPGVYPVAPTLPTAQGAAQQTTTNRSLRVGDVNVNVTAPPDADGASLGTEVGDAARTALSYLQGE